MKHFLPITLLALALGSGTLAGESRAANAEQHQHQVADNPALTATPAGGARWAPDEPLRKGMRQMRDALDGLAHHEAGQLGNDEVRELATGVDEAVAFMFANCKLDPEPDQALHDILARLMSGARALHAKPADPTPVASMRAALEDYPKLFDDPTLFAPDDEGR